MTKVIPASDPLNAAERRVAELGLNHSLLMESVRRGFAAWASCTPNHPVSYPGLAAWGEMMCALGETHSTLGWIRKDERGQPLIVNEDGSIAVTAATGDCQVGKADGPEPRTRSSKGKNTQHSIDLNNGWLFPEMEEEFMLGVDSAARQTWFILVFRDVEAQETRCELSRPIKMNGGKKIIEWSERIILDSTSFDGYSAFAPTPSGPPSGSSEIIVEIKRRA